MIKRTKIEVWMSMHPEEGEGPIKTEDIAKIVEDMKKKLLSLDNRVIVVGMTTTEEI